MYHEPERLVGNMMLASMTVFQILLSLFYILTCLLLIGVILLQKGRGGGLAAAFGGGGATSAFGAKTGDFFTWVTVGLAVVCLLTAVVSNYAFRPSDPTAAAAPTAQPAPGGSVPVSAPQAPGEENAPAGQADLPAPTVESTAAETGADSDFSNDDTP